MAKRMGTAMISVALLILTCTLVMTTSRNATASQDIYNDLMGEWSGVWPGESFDRAAIVIHEINPDTSKAKITFLVDRLDSGHEEHEIVADFVPDPVPTIKFKVAESNFTCEWRKRARKLDVSYEGHTQRGANSNSCRMEKKQQIFSNIDKLLADNPLPEGKKSQAITVSGNDNATIYLIRSTEGAGLEPHFHAKHDETVYVIKGSGQLLVDGKWVDLSPGSIHFNPAGKTHANRQVGAEPLVLVSVFTPGMKDPDRHFIKK